MLEQALGSVAVSARLCTRCGEARQRVEGAENGCRGTRDVSFIQQLLERIGCLGNVHGLYCAKRNELIVAYTKHRKRLRCALIPHFDWPKQFLHRISIVHSTSIDRTLWVCTHVVRIRISNIRLQQQQHSMLTCAVFPDVLPQHRFIQPGATLPEQCTSTYNLMRRGVAAARLTVSILSATCACTLITANLPAKTSHC